MFASFTSTPVFRKLLWPLYAGEPVDLLASETDDDWMACLSKAADRRPSLMRTCRRQCLLLFPEIASCIDPIHTLIWRGRLDIAPLVDVANSADIG